MVQKINFNKFLKERYEPQVEWYDKSAILNKKLYYLSRIIVIILSALTPVFAALDFKNLTIVFSALIAIGTGVITFCRFDEHWHNYRSTCESLKKEKDYYDYKTDAYRDEKVPDKLFIDRVNALISSEHTTWFSIAVKSKQKKRT